MRLLEVACSIHAPGTMYVMSVFDTYFPCSSLHRRHFILITEQIDSMEGCPLREIQLESKDTKAQLQIVAVLMLTIPFAELDSEPRI